MVCFTYAIWLIRSEFPAYSPEKISKTCDQIRVKFKTHRVDLTEEIQDAMKGLERGGAPAIFSIAWNHIRTKTRQMLKS